MTSDAYDLVSVQGKTVDKMTAKALAHWQDILGHPLRLVQGSPNTTVSASGGTHDGHGVVDVVATDDVSWQDIVLTGRYAGFAVWHRTPDQGPWSEHFHGVLRGNGMVSVAAAVQVDDYQAGLNGLAGHALDPQPRPEGAILPFNYYLRDLDWQGFKNRKSAPMPKRHAMRVQRALNARIDAGLVIDDKWGPVSEHAFSVWVRMLRKGTVERRALRLLGGGRFNLLVGEDD